MMKSKNVYAVKVLIVLIFIDVILHKDFSIYRAIMQHLRVILKLCPELVFTVQKDILEFVSVLDNSHKFPQLYMHLVWAVGEYASPNYR